MEEPSIPPGPSKDDTTEVAAPPPTTASSQDPGGSPPNAKHGFIPSMIIGALTRADTTVQRFNR